MNDNTPALLLAVALSGLIGLAIGAAIGLILAGLRSPAPPGSHDRKDAVEAARLLHDARTGQLSVEINGKKYAARTALNAAQRAALVQVHDELQLWLGVEDLPGRAAAAPPVSAPARPSPTAAPPVGGPPAHAAEPLPPTQRVPPPDPEAPAPPARPRFNEPTYNVRPPSLNMQDILARAINPPSTAPQAPEGPKTLAGQVDAIIQERLPQTPLKDRVIQLNDAPDGSILVVVDGRKFGGIGEVAEPEVRQFLQACVAEWEKRYGK